uniref:Transmembrane protein 42a n=1 Tax=Neolamprologus brichardi TaxID=32507 RepID=A0A3Q4GEG1_NEOBR
MIIYQCALYSVSFYLCAGTKALLSDFHREKAWDEWIQKEHRVADKGDLHIPLRLLCGGLLFACNAVMWTTFSKALRHSTSTARATVTTTASNFISSGLLGRLFFGESHATLWWAGISLTLCGLLMLHGSAPQTHPQEADKKDQ